VSTEEPMNIEDRVRAATRAGATLVREIGPMAAEPETVRVRRRLAAPGRSWGTWGIPLAAAAAVALVAVGLVAIRSATVSAPANHPVTPTAPTAVPRYYVALDQAGTEADGYTGTGRLIIGDDQTGRAIAAVTPPHGLEFAAVRGASDDRTLSPRPPARKRDKPGRGRRRGTCSASPPEPLIRTSSASCPSHCRAAARPVSISPFHRTDGNWRSSRSANRQAAARPSRSRSTRSLRVRNCAPGPRARSGSAWPPARSPGFPAAGSWPSPTYRRGPASWISCAPST